MKEKLKKLFNSISNWEYSFPLETEFYRYRDNPTIYKSTTGKFNPSERAILVHRYVNRYLKGKYVRFYLEDRDENELAKGSCWTYAYIMSVCHMNSYSSIYGYMRVNYISANTLSYEEIEVNSWTEVTIEEITENEYQQLINLVKMK